jgi:hypothetical protein
MEKDCLLIKRQYKIFSMEPTNGLLIIDGNRYEKKMREYD